MSADLTGALAEAAAPPRPPAWGPWVGGFLAVALLAAAILQLRHASAEALAMVVRLPPVVWVTFAALYLVQPTADFVIFRRLWRLPAGGFAVLLRKVVINEVLFGYSGELYFYFWARRRAGLTQAPFGAIKDVNILSALGGNVLTLAMLGLSLAEAGRVDLARQFGPALWPGLVFVALSFAILLFARRVFSLTRGQLLFTAAVHAVRLATVAGLTLTLWSLALPGVAAGVWVVLLASKLLLARLPFVSNKDLLFANLVLVLFGAGSPAALLLATLAIVTLLTHLAVVALIGAADLLGLARHDTRPFRNPDAAGP